MLRNICLFGLGLTLVLSLAPSLKADVILADGLDASARTDTAGAQGGGVFGLQNPNGTQIRVGRFTTGDGIAVSAVYVFELPDLGATVDPFLSADLEFTFLGGDGPTGANLPTDYNADLYGIDSRGAGTVVPADDFFAGPGPDPNAVLFQEDILTPTTATGRINSVDISSYLNDQYDGGTGAGEFVFLRFSPDYDPSTIVDSREGYLIASATNATAAPVINFTTAVPEPSSVAVLLLGVSVISSRRRRSR